MKACWEWKSCVFLAVLLLRGKDKLPKERGHKEEISPLSSACGSVTKKRTLPLPAVVAKNIGLIRAERRGKVHGSRMSKL